MFELGPTAVTGPSFRFIYIHQPKTTMSDTDETHQIQIKREQQNGVINIEDLQLSQWWFPLHIRSAGSILAVGLVVVAIFCVWRMCRKKSMIKMYQFCVSCRKNKTEEAAKREEEHILEMLERDVDRATTSHHGRGHGRGHRGARRGGHNGGPPRGHGHRLAMESPHGDGHGWGETEETQLATALKHNLECMARLAMPEVHSSTRGTRG